MRCKSRAERDGETATPCFNEPDRMCPIPFRLRLPYGVYRGNSAEKVHDYFPKVYQARGGATIQDVFR